MLDQTFNYESRASVEDVRSKSVTKKAREKVVEIRIEDSVRSSSKNSSANVLSDSVGDLDAHFPNGPAKDPLHDLLKVEQRHYS